MTALFALTLLLATAFPPGVAPTDIAALRTPGTAVPAKPLTNIAGGTLSLTASAGRPTVIVVFASWCDPCLEHLPAVVGASHGSSARFVGIDALESIAKAKAVVTKYKVTFSVASLSSDEFDRPGVTDEQRGATGLDIPAVYVIDPRGNSCKAFVGPDAYNVTAIQSSLKSCAAKP
jgi:peroxiredoxin